MSCHCSTPTCFTYRRRAAGSKPIRRFNSMSARQLAVTLASRDNPESALCAHLRSQQGGASNKGIKKHSKQVAESDPKKSIEALNEALIKSGRQPLSRAEHTILDGHDEGSARDTDLSCSPARSKTKSESVSPTTERRRTAPKPHVDKWAEEQRDVRIDPKSFVQNVFNTDAMRMLEWLTPSSVDGLTSRIKEALSVSSPKEDERSKQQHAEKGATVDVSKATTTETKQAIPIAATDFFRKPKSEEPPSRGEEAVEKMETQNSAVPPLNKHRRRSDLRGISPPGIKPYTSSVLPELQRREPDMEKFAKLARVNSWSDDNGLQRRKSSEKRTKMNLSPSIKSAAMFGHEVVLPTLGECPIAPPKVAIITPPEELEKAEHKPKVEEHPAKMPAAESRTANSTKAPEQQAFPQSLGVLSEESLEMLCTILTADAPLDLYAKPLNIDFFNPKVSMVWARKGTDPLAGKRLPNSATAWRAFAEQSLFYVLSDSRTLLRSFTYETGGLMSSTSLNHAFLRILRVASDVMLDALWIAAGDLFQMPTDLAELQDSSKHGNPKLSSSKAPLNRKEAGNVIAILFNALIAMLPAPPKDSRFTEVTYKERQRGHSYIREMPGPLALELDDALSDDLALRLAKRLFAAISVRDSFMLLSHRNGLRFSFLDDGVSALFQSLPGVITSDSTDIGDLALRASNEGTRIFGLGLRAWATKIFMEEWDGLAIIPRGGAIGGALAILQALNNHHVWALEYSPSDAMVMPFISDRLDASDISVEWLSFNTKVNQDHLLNYPFLFPKETLVTYFRAINFSRMSAAYDNAVGIHHRIQALAQPNTLVTGNARMNFLCEKLRVAMSRFMVLNIKRTSPLQDAFDQLWRREERELLRPLKIKLGEDGGELGSDSGGVQAEFFRLAIAEAMNPDYGCFTVEERTKMAWLVPSSPEPIWKFEMIGLIFGLAVYNGLTLPVTFPTAFYAKLLGKEVGSCMEIQDGWPDLASGFQTLLEWDESNGSVEEVFCRTYEFSVEAFGNQISRDMTKMPDEEGNWPQSNDLHSADNKPASKEDIEEAPMVTKLNRVQYVKDYIHFLTDASIRPQFEAFQKGFRQIIDYKSLTLFKPEILQEVVEGVQEVDISELERVVRYEGYTSSSPTIRDFWAVVREYNQEDRKKLLEFVTASDRVPVGGMTGITFVIQRNGQAEEGVAWGDSGLPTRSRAGSGASDAPQMDGEGLEHTFIGIEPTPTSIDANFRGTPDQRVEAHRNAARTAAAAERAQEERDNAGNKARLPTAYTCYGTLLLPEYRDRETLRRKLGMALENAKGFGFA